MYKKRMLIDFDSTSTNNLMIDFHIYNLLVYKMSGIGGNAHQILSFTKVELANV